MDVSHGSSTRFLEDTVNDEKEVKKRGSGKANTGFNKIEENSIDDENYNGNKMDGQFNENIFRTRNIDQGNKVRKIAGSPTLQLHHTAPQTPGSRGSTKLAQNNERGVEKNIQNVNKIDFEDSVNKEKSMGESNEKTKIENEYDSTERIIQRTLRFSSHEDLIQFLHILLRFSPFLRSDEIENYFEFCQIL